MLRNGLRTLDVAARWQRTPKKMNPALAREIGASVRQTQRYLTELERNRLLRREARLSESGQTSNAYVFLWHPIFEHAVTNMTPEGVTDLTPEGVTDPSPKDSQIED